jgi:hypothetical protein
VVPIAEVRSAVALAAIVDSAEVPIVAVPIAEDSAAALAAVVLSAEAHMVVVLTVADTAAVAAEWADADRSEH